MGANMRSQPSGSIGNRLSMPNHTEWRRKTNFCQPEVYGANGNSKLCRQVIKCFIFIFFIEIWTVQQHWRFASNASAGRVLRNDNILSFSGKFVSRYPEFRTQYRRCHMHAEIVAGMHFEVYCTIFRAATAAAAAAISIRTCIKFVHCHCHLVENAISFSVCETEFSLLRRYGYVYMCRRRRAVSSFAPFCIHIPYALHT